MGWIAPRGIVAAAISSLFVIKMQSLGYKEADLLVPLTFIVIIGTILIQSLTARSLAKSLKVKEDDPTGGVLLIGANIVAREIACSLKENGFNVVVSDSNWDNITESKMKGLETYYGRIVSDNADDKIAFEKIGKMIALSPDRLLNFLSCTRFKMDFGSGNIFYVQNTVEKENRNNKVIHKSYSGRPLFSENVTYQKLASLLSNNGVIKTTKLSEEFSFENYLQEYENRVIPLYYIDSKEKLHFFSSNNELKIDIDIKITSLIYK